MPTNRNVDLIAIVVWAVATATAVALSDSQLLRLVLALPLLLLFTGHSLLRAFGPVATSASEHAVCAIGLSIAVALATGFLLNRLGALVPMGWALSLLAIVGASLAIALWRNRPAEPYLVTPSLSGLRARHAVMIGLAAAVIAGAYERAASDASKQRQFNYVNFWMVAGARAPGGLVVGIESAEREPQLFDVEITSGEQVVAVWRSVALNPGERWTRNLSLGVDPLQDRKFDGRLYRHSDGKLYRQVSAILPPA
jgi:hypothetical protein